MQYIYRERERDIYIYICAVRFFQRRLPFSVALQVGSAPFTDLILISSNSEPDGLNLTSLFPLYGDQSASHLQTLSIRTRNAKCGDRYGTLVSLSLVESDYLLPSLIGVSSG